MGRGLKASKALADAGFSDLLQGHTLVSKFAPGQEVEFRLSGQPGQKQRGTIEEVCFAYGMRTPIYVIDFWMDGSFNQQRLHERDLEAV